MISYEPETPTVADYYGDQFFSCSSKSSETASLDDNEKEELEAEQRKSETTNTVEKVTPNVEMSDEDALAPSAKAVTSSSEEYIDEAEAEKERLRKLNEAARIEREWLERERQEAERQAQEVY